MNILSPRGACACALLVLSALSSTGTAAGRALDLTAAEHDALDRDALLQALEARAGAMSARARADGALPDPEVSLGYSNAPVDDLTGSDMMTMAMVSVRQRFPAGATRHLERSRGELEAEAIRVERDERALDVRMSVRRAWLDWRYAADVHILLEAAEQQLIELLEITERRFATGAAGRQDVARARLERATMAERRIGWAARRKAAAAELTRWLGGGVTRPGNGPDWPAPDETRLAERIPEHPALERAALRESMGEVGADLAREAYKPTWMVEVGYGYRRGREPMTGASQSDSVSGMVTLSVPLFTANRQDQRLSAAVQEREAARFDQIDRLRDFHGRLDRQLALWRSHAELVELYEEVLLPAAVETRTAMLDAYGRDRATFDEVIRAQLDEVEHEMGALQAVRQRDEAWLELRYLGGE